MAETKSSRLRDWNDQQDGYAEVAAVAKDGGDKQEVSQVQVATTLPNLRK